MTNLEFSVDKFYRTRDGRKAQIFMLDNGMDMMLGAVYIASKGHNLSRWANVTWYQNGMVSPDDNEGHFDLVSEWRDPRSLTFNAYVFDPTFDEYAFPFIAFQESALGRKTKVKVNIEELPDDAH